MAFHSYPSPRLPSITLGLVLVLVYSTVACGGMKGDSVELMSWVQSVDLPPGEARSVLLPEALRAQSQDGLAHIARLSDGRRCVLLKQKIGWKENFEGTLTCDEPLRPAELVSITGAPTTITLVGLGAFEEIFVREQVDARTWRVYFDLN